MEKRKTKTTRRGFSKFIRHPERYPLQLQARDLEILSLIHDYRLAQSDQVIRLIGGSERKILARLQRLFHHGYLERLCDRRIRTRAGSDKMIYAITDMAGELLKAELGLSVSKVNRSSENRSATDRHIKHTLMVGRFRTTLTLAAGEAGSSLEFWKENRGTGQNINAEISDKVMIPKGNGRKTSGYIIPDAFFSLNSSGTPYFFYLEADRSTMTNERFLKKLEAYWAWWKQGGSRKKHGVENFRVLTITPSHERRDNLKQIALQASPTKGGSGMFWFACEKDYLVSAPQSLLGKIWITAKSDERRALLE